MSQSFRVTSADFRRAVNLIATRCLILMAAVSPGVAQSSDEDEDYPPGLVAKYASGGDVGSPRISIERVDADVQFAWGIGAPDARLIGRSFDVAWSGKILVRAAGKYRFHVFVHGAAAVVVDGRTLIDGRRETAGWLDSDETQLDFGEHSLTVTFKQTQRESQVRLFWSCKDTFPIEPVPPQVLFHDAARADLKQLERGRELFDAHRCNRCHRREADPPSSPGPDLTRVAVDLDRDWLVNWLRQPAGWSPHSRMPSFEFTRDEASAAAEFLIAQSIAQKPDSVPPQKTPAPDDSRKGELLFRSIGCLACHTHGELGQPQTHSGGDLTSVGRKRSFDWIAAWLDDPAKLNADHRMPVVKLLDAERRRVAAYLVGGSPRAAGVERSEPPAQATSKSGGSQSSTPATPTAAPNSARSIALGRQLVQAARCADCHRIPGVDRPRDASKPLTDSAADWSQSCIQRTTRVAGVERSELPERTASKSGGSQGSTPATLRRPSFQFSHDDLVALQAYIASRRGPLAAESRFVRGARLLRELNCLACHERDGSSGIGPVAAAVAKIDADLQGQSEALIPPDLTAVGDKLHDQALATAIRGGQSTVRMPWLRVRMPRFNHSTDDTAALLAYLIGHDRISIEQPADAASSNSPDEAQRRKLADAGRKLVGPQGWSCTACHKVGEFEPRNVALGTRGSNLHRIDNRMRFEFFVRWTRSPLRIIPGMEMPSYENPVAGILKSDVDEQLRAVWEALRDERTPVSADLPAVEQIVRVERGQPARIIRDVFRIPKNGGTPLASNSSPKGAEGKREFDYVPRAFVVGLNNGVNVMFDLDAMAIRRVWLGETARQVTSGKSWFWEPGAGATTLFDKAATDPDIGLRKQTSGTEETKAKSDVSSLVVAQRDFAQHGRLFEYRPNAGGVRLTYRLMFDIDGRDVPVDVTETWVPIHSNRAGSPIVWERRLRVTGIPTGFEAVVTRGNARNLGHTLVTRPPSTEIIATRASLTIVNQIRDAAPPASPVDSATTPPMHPAATQDMLDTVPGFEVTRLPLDRGIMPTALGWDGAGRLVFCSLKGHVFTARDTDGDGIEDRLDQFEEGLAAPYGIILDANGRDLLVAHKPELLRLRDSDGDGKADVREVVATGWGCSEDYHDWTFGIVRDSRGRLYLGLGSDYAKPRPPEFSRWRGKVMRVETDGRVTPIGSAFRYPTGLAITADDQVFVSDNQGVQNTFNEINHLVDGGHYGVPAQTDEQSPKVVLDPAIKVPHPWTRSVNGIFFWTSTERRVAGVERSEPPERTTPKAAGGSLRSTPATQADHPFAGHGIGCEYDTKALVRFTLQRIGDTFQGAVYPYSKPDTGTLLGTLCGGVAPNGEIYIGSIHDSGWLGGRNVGEIVRLRALAADKLPLGIRELRASADGMVIDFTAPVDRAAASQPDNFAISGYTRKWQGAYATPDSGRHKVAIKSAVVSTDDRQVTLKVDRWQAGFVYEVSCARIGLNPQAALWPAVGHYTMNVVPGSEQKSTKEIKNE